MISLVFLVEQQVTSLPTSVKTHQPQNRTIKLRLRPLLFRRQCCLLCHGRRGATFFVKHIFTQRLCQRPLSSICVQTFCETEPSPAWEEEEGLSPPRHYPPRPPPVFNTLCQSLSVGVHRGECLWFWSNRDDFGGTRSQWRSILVNVWSLARTRSDWSRYYYD